MKSGFLVLKQLVYTILLIGLSSCEFLQYSPHAFDLGASERDLNAKNLIKLEGLPKDDTIRFVVTGDSQESTDELQQLVQSVNELSNVDFLIIAGDLTQKSTAREYKWVHRELSQLKVPYFAVVGNHDLERNGEYLFQMMYGDLNFSFEYQNTKFIAFNNNSYIYDFDGSIPDLGWLRSEMEQLVTAENIVFVSHIPPEWKNQTDSLLGERYKEMIGKNKKVLLSAHAHTNRFLHRQIEDGADFLHVPSIDVNPAVARDQSYVVVTIIGNDLNLTKMQY